MNGTHAAQSRDLGGPADGAASCTFGIPTPLDPKLAEVNVHPSAARAPEGGVFRVESEDTKYEEEGIRARFVDRGAEVTRKLCQS